MEPSSTQGRRTGIYTLKDLHQSHTVTQPTHGSRDEVKKADNEDNKHVTQIGRGGHNPQMIGDIKVGDGGNINLGLQEDKDIPQEDKDIPQENKDIPQDNKDCPRDNKGNAQIGGGGHNPQLHGNISAGAGGTVNLGVQRKKDSPKDNKDSPQDNKDSPKDNKDSPQDNNPQDNKDKKHVTQIGRGGHNPQMIGDIKVGDGGNINLGLQEDKDIPQENKDIPQDNKDNPQDNKDCPRDNKGNAQIGGGGHNPQLHGNISAGAGGTVNLGVQRKKDSPKDNKDNPQDNKEKKLMLQGKNLRPLLGVNSPQVQGNISAGDGYVNLGVQGIVQSEKKRRRWT